MLVYQRVYMYIYIYLLSFDRRVCRCFETVVSGFILPDFDASELGTKGATHV